MTDVQWSPEAEKYKEWLRTEGVAQLVANWEQDRIDRGVVTDHEDCARITYGTILSVSLVLSDAEIRAEEIAIADAEEEGQTSGAVVIRELHIALAVRQTATREKIRIDREMKGASDE